MVVRVGGEVVAETSRPVKLFETSLPPRWYVPRADVRDSALVDSDTHTTCPYKGVASYHSVHGGDMVITDGAWYYPHPMGDSAAIEGHVSFLGRGIEVLVDGQRASGT